MAFTIRKAARDDLDALLCLYAHLHAEAPPPPEAARRAWEAVLSDPNHHLLLGEADSAPVSTCALVVIPNLTRGTRPYGLIENVVTHPERRGEGRATALLHRASELAREAGCYKVMLLTGRGDEATLRFYRGAGFNSEDKAAFIQWL